jgi:hypothetical protein
VYARALFLSSSTSIRTLIQKYLCFFKPQHSSPPSALLQLQECLSSACAERIKCLLKVFLTEAIFQSQSIPEVPRQTVCLFWTSRTCLKHQHCCILFIPSYRSRQIAFQVRSPQARPRLWNFCPCRTMLLRADNSRSNLESSGGLTSATYNLVRRYLFRFPE